MKFRSVFLFFIAMAFAAVGNAGSVSFYVVGHEDDWQLFMNPTAFDDVNNASVDKVVFIYLTAGDAGNRATNTYYTARENGANRSVRFMADAEAVGLAPTTGSTVFINGNSINKVVYKKTVSYFLRLPDGNGEGEGFPLSGNQSLQKLYAGQIAAMPIVTALYTSTAASTTYFGWNELLNTLRQIVQLEGKGKNPVVANMPDPDVESDHSDHKHTGIAMRDAVSSFPCVKQVFFNHYPTGTMPENLSTAGIINEAATFGAMTTGLAEAGYNSSYDWIHKWAIGKNYFRTIAGVGNCTF